MEHWSSWIILLLTPLIWLIFSTSCLLFWAYRKLVHIILKIKIGSQYGGLLDFNDAFTVFEEKGKCVILSAAVYKSEHNIDMLAFTKKRLQEEVFSNLQNYPKITSTLHMYRGYAYWLKNSVKLDECVKTFPSSQDGQFDENYLKKVAGDIYNSPLPHNNTAMWEFSIGDKPIISKSGEKLIYRYPVVLRFHHVVGDGTSAYAFLARIYNEDRNKNYTDEIFKKQNNKKSDNLPTYLTELFKRIFKIAELTFYIVFLMFQQRLELIHWRPKDTNALHGPEMSGKKIIVWSAEDRTELVPLVKKIKNEIPETTFSHVVLTAVAASFANYFKKQPAQVPNVMSAFLTMMLYYSASAPNKPVALRNNSTAALLELPVKGSNSLMDLMKTVKENTSRITYIEAQTNLLFNHYIFGLFPVSIRTSFHEAGSYTAIISNVPAGSKVEFMDGYVEKVIACPPNVKNIGVSLGIITYDDRFQIALMVDKSVMPSQEKAQEIVDDIFNNFKLLDMETKLMFKSGTKQS